MKSTIATIVLILTSLLATGQTKVGTVNSELIVGLLPEMKKVVADLDLYAKELDSSYQIKDKEYQEKIADFQNQGDVSDKFKKIKLDEISELEQKLQQSLLFKKATKFSLVRFRVLQLDLIKLTIHTYKIKNVLYLETEHRAVIETVQSTDINKVKCQLTTDGVINLAEFENHLRSLSGKTLVCVMFVNNETGVLQPIEDISKICKKYEALFFSDMIQALGKMDVRQAVAYVDFASFASHKIGGLHGVGHAYMRNSQPVYKQVFGGEQEIGRKAGTENVIGITAFQIALEACISKMVSEHANNLKLHI